VSWGPSRRQEVWHVKARHPDTVVGHPVINVEALRWAKIVTLVDARGEHNVGYGPGTLLGQHRHQHRRRRPVEDDPRVLPRKHHNPGRVGQFMSAIGRALYLAHTVVNDQPPMPGQDARGAAADLQALPGRLRGCQPVMRSELAQVVRTVALQRHRGVRDPDALPIGVNVTGLRVAGSLLGTCAR
jgi:hypothetical protein